MKKKMFFNETEMPFSGSSPLKMGKFDFCAKIYQRLRFPLGGNVTKGLILFKSNLSFCGFKSKICNRVLIRWTNLCNKLLCFIKINLFFVLKKQACFYLRKGLSFECHFAFNYNCTVKVVRYVVTLTEFLN
jgi:hypothetical protein